MFYPENVFLVGTVGTVGTATNHGACSVPTKKPRVGTVGTHIFPISNYFHVLFPLHKRWEQFTPLKPLLQSLVPAVPAFPRNFFSGSEREVLGARLLTGLKYFDPGKKPEAAAMTKKTAKNDSTTDKPTEGADNEKASAASEKKAARKDTKEQLMVRLTPGQIMMAELLADAFIRKQKAKASKQTNATPQPESEQER